MIFFLNGDVIEIRVKLKENFFSSLFSEKQYIKTSDYRLFLPWQYSAEKSTQHPDLSEIAPLGKR